MSRLMVLMAALALYSFIGLAQAAPAAPAVTTGPQVIDILPLTEAPATIATPDAGELALIKEILATIKDGDIASQQVAEDKLVKNSSEAALRFVLNDQEKTLAQAEADESRAAESVSLRLKVNVLDTAIIRLTWKLDPNKIIKDCFAKIPSNWNDRGVRVTDDRVAGVFPNNLFYSANMIPPVADAGFKTPEPALVKNLFIISKDGSVERLTDSAGLKKFFIANWKTADKPITSPRSPIITPLTPIQPPGATDAPAPPKLYGARIATPLRAYTPTEPDNADAGANAQDAMTNHSIARAAIPAATLPGGNNWRGGGMNEKRNLIYSWLRLTTVFSPVACTITERDIRVEIAQTATIGSKPHYVLTGKTVPAKGTGYAGEISVIMFLNDKTGGLQDIIETNKLQVSQALNLMPGVSKTQLW